MTMTRLIFLGLLLAVPITACKTVERNGAPTDIKTLAPAAFDHTIRGNNSSSFAARLYRVLETSATSMQDAEVPIPELSGSSVSVARHGDFVSCDRASNSCRIATTSAELPWTADDESIQAVLYRALVLAQGGQGLVSLVGGDSHSLDCARRRSFGQTEFQCVFKLVSGQDSQ
jgi:predicted small secreted protein